MSNAELAARIDHTALKATVTRNEVEKLCAEALEHGFASVCVNPVHVSLAAARLGQSPVRVCTVIGFPLGANRPETKAFETDLAVRQGAREVDMVLNVGAVKDGDWDLVETDIRAVVNAAREAADGVVVKVILETCFLTDDEKRRACLIAKKAGADYVKTSTGFGSGGATTHDVALMRESVGPRMGVKASGGIGDAVTARAMIEAGATRLGASAGVRIVEA